MASGRYAEAVPLYQQLVSAMPGNAGLVLNLGMAQHMARQDRAAIQQFETALKIQPGLYPALAMMGASWMRLGQPAAALPPLREAARLKPGDPAVREMLADGLLAVGRAHEAGAGRAFEQLTRSATGSAWWLGLIAESRVKSKQNSSAFYFYRQALAKNPKLPGAHAALAGIYRDTGHADWAKAEEENERALRSSVCSAVPAQCSYAAGRYQDVLSATRLAKTPEALYWRVKAYNALALSMFSELSALGPSVPLHRLQAEQYRNEGRFPEALQELRRAEQLQPADPGLRQEIASTVYMSKDYAAAEPLLRKLVNEKPQLAEAHFLLGDALLQLQRVEEAILLLTKAVRTDPKLLAARASLGRALMQTGEAGKAIPHLQAALPIDEDGSLYFQLMRAAQTSGDGKLAAEAMQNYQAKQKANEQAKRELEEQASITAP